MCVNGVNGVPVLLHPLAFDYRVNLQKEMTHRSATATRSHSVETKPKVEAAAMATPNMKKHMAAEKLAQLAKQLHDQVKESAAIFQEFHDGYNKDVKHVRQYISGDVCRLLWDGKVEQNTKYSEGAGQENKQLRCQANKLKVCLTRFDKMASMFRMGNNPDNPADHDSRSLHLEKIQATGSRVDRLVRKALSSEAACKDLIDELKELQAFLDPRRHSGAHIYRFDQRKIVVQPSMKNQEEGTGEKDGGSEDNDDGQNGDENATDAETGWQ